MEKEIPGFEKFFSQEKIFFSNTTRPSIDINMLEKWYELYDVEDWLDLEGFSEFLGFSLSLKDSFEESEMDKLNQSSFVFLLDIGEAEDLEDSFNQIKPLLKKFSAEKNLNALFNPLLSKCQS